MTVIARDKRVTTQVINLIKKYEKILSDDNKNVDKATLEWVVSELKNELYKYKPSATFDLYEGK